MQPTTPNEIEVVVDEIERIVDKHVDCWWSNPKPDLVVYLTQLNANRTAEMEAMVLDIPNALHKYGAWLLVNYEDVEPLERKAKKQEITKALAQAHGLKL